MGWTCSEIETSRRISVLTLNKQLVLTYNFATGKFVTATHKLWTLATVYFLVSSFQNCELKQEFRTLATALNQPHKFSDQRKDVIKHSRWIGLELCRNRNFATNFCFNSKQTACFDLQFCHWHHRIHNPQTQNNDNQIITDLFISKLWVKTRTPHPGNRAIPTPQIPQSWKKVFFSHLQRCSAGLELFRNRNFATNFCFNSKPSFSFDSWRQQTKFPVTSAFRCKPQKNRFRVKTPQLWQLTAAN